MSSIPTRQFLANTALAGFDPVILAFIKDLRSEGICERDIVRQSGPARHFLIWCARKDIALEAVDGTAIDSFLQHDCDCLSGVPTSPRLRPWRKCRTSPRLMKFIRFLNRTGRVEVPGDLDDNLRLLHAFLERLRGNAYSLGYFEQHRQGCPGLIVFISPASACAI